MVVRSLFTGNYERCERCLAHTGYDLSGNPCWFNTRKRATNILIHQKLLILKGCRYFTGNVSKIIELRTSWLKEGKSCSSLFVELVQWPNISYLTLPEMPGMKLGVMTVTWFRGSLGIGSFPLWMYKCEISYDTSLTLLIYNVFQRWRL
jgi:hypothetical protein